MNSRKKFPHVNHYYLLLFGFPFPPGFRGHLNLNFLLGEKIGCEGPGLRRPLVPLKFDDRAMTMRNDTLNSQKNSPKPTIHKSVRKLKLSL